MFSKDANSVGAMIQRLRHERGLKVRQLADMVGRSPGYISRVEVRGEIPSPDLLLVFAERFGVDPEPLIDIATQETLDRSEKKTRERYAAALALYRSSK